MISAILESFSIILLKTLINENQSGNVFSSPMSIMTAFSMVMMGAKNDSKNQLIESLKINSNDLENIHQNIGEFIEKCLPVIRQNDNTTLSIANGLFIHENFQIHDQYKSGLVQYYKTEMKSINFTNPEAFREVNQWIENKTNDKIKDIFKEGDLTIFTRLVLANAVYFKSSFRDQFSLHRTRERLFHVDSNSKYMVQMMQTNGDFEYFENSNIGLKALSILFRNNFFSLVLALPIKRFGLDEALVHLNDTDLKNLVKSQHLRKVSNLEMPKFKVETTIDLKITMASLGVRDIFDPYKADLFGISDTPLFVDTAIHKTFLDVNEYGVEAAAATAISLSLLGMSFDHKTETPVEFIADEPFLLIVYHRLYDAILFLGRINKP